MGRPPMRSHRRSAPTRSWAPDGVCVPHCSGQPCGVDDGCEGLCGGQTSEDPEADALGAVVDQAIAGGLIIGRDALLTALSESLSAYEPDQVDVAHWSLSEQSPPACPLVSPEGAPMEGMSCAMVLDMARVQAVSSLDQALEDNPYLEGLEQPEDVAEVSFWYEQGAVGGVDLWARVLAEDLPHSGLCPVDSSTVELARTRGRIHGAGLMADAFNAALTELSHGPSYPEMDQGTDLCGLGDLDPETSLEDAQERVVQARLGPGPCDLSEPPGDGDVSSWTAERDAWESGLEQGVLDEYNLLTDKLRLLW